MIYRTLGRTALQVSAIALGCEGFSGRTPDEAMAMMDFAIANGINFIDLYASDPVLRSTIGQTLRGRRNDFIIQAHVGSIWKNG